MTDQEYNYTPDETCEAIIKYLDLDPTKSYCEAFSGNHNIFKLLPPNKEYYEIQEGKDFFECDKQYSTIITNPPYRDYTTDRNNILVDCFEKCFEVATEKCVFLINARHGLNCITPVRLKKWEKQDWVITDICVLAIKKWYGRYYLITFEKGVKNKKILNTI
tara:strand:+ start:701 stop:1186 length:486 start_codon:yes stop_codon:yes gene_type:complete